MDDRTFYLILFLIWGVVSYMVGYQTGKEKE